MRIASAGAVEGRTTRCELTKASWMWGFHGAAPTAQRAGAAQAVVGYTVQPISDPSTQAQVQAIDDGLVPAIKLLKEVRAVLVEKRLIKGECWWWNPRSG